VPADGIWATIAACVPLPIAFARSPRDAVGFRIGGPAGARSARIVRRGRVRVPAAVLEAFAGEGTGLAGRRVLRRATIDE